MARTSAQAPMRCWTTFALLLAAVLGCSIHTSADLAGDANGLLVLKNGVDVHDALQWSNATISNVCQWKGVGCSGSTPRVTSLRLPGVGLYGPLPKGSLGQLTELRVISLRSNKLAGGFPLDLINCKFLRSIYLQNNDLSGTLPSDFTNWPNLVHLDLSSNNFTGTIPSSMTNLAQLKSLLLEGNSFSGSIPPLQTSSLKKFSVANNHLSGPIPDTATLHGFNSSAFLGNDLCGPPLPACTGEAPASSPSSIGEAVPNRKHRKKLSGGAIAGIVIGSIFLLLLVALLCLFAFKRGRSRARKNPYTSTAVATSALERAGVQPKTEYAAAAAGASSEPDRNRLVFFEGSKYAFDLEDLLRASAEVLGKGSVGTAYKAVLENGSIVAVKRLRDVTTERKDFEHQIAIIGKLKHGNLVPLIAYYYSKEEKLLVSEYMTNGSLSALLHGSKGVNKTPLDWDSRVRIALGTAQAMDYLHDQGCTHGNIKSSNVLLTNNYSSCVSDYGLAQLVSATSAANKIVGYRAPEVTDIRRITPKADVYSYGVLLLELLTGKAPFQASMSDEGIDLPRWVQSVVREEWTAEVFDLELMRFQYTEEEMVSMLHIAMACVAPSPDQRPTIKHVVKMVENLGKPEDDNAGMPISPSSLGASVSS